MGAISTYTYQIRQKESVNNMSKVTRFAAIFTTTAAVALTLCACDKAVTESLPSASVIPEHAATSVVKPSATPDIDSKADTDKDTDTAAKSESVLQTIRTEMIDSLEIENYLDIDENRLQNVYGISAEDFTESASFVTMSGVFPHEVILVEAKDDDAAERISEKLENRLEEVRNQYRDYDAESYAMAEECSVDTDGEIVSLLLSPEHKAMRDILTDNLT